MGSHTQCSRRAEICLKLGRKRRGQSRGEGGRGTATSSVNLEIRKGSDVPGGQGQRRTVSHRQQMQSPRKSKAQIPGRIHSRPARQESNLFPSSRFCMGGFQHLKGKKGNGEEENISALSPREREKGEGSSCLNVENG